METDVSMRKREISEREDLSEPLKKRFKSNMDPIKQASQKQLTLTRTKNTPLKHQQKRLPVAYTNKHLNIQKYMRAKTLSQLYAPKTVVFDKEIVPTMAPFEIFQNKVIWCQIDEADGLLYQLSSGWLGCVFPDGSNLVISDFK